MKVSNNPLKTSQLSTVSFIKLTQLGCVILFLAMTSFAFGKAAHFLYELGYPEGGQQILEAASVTCDAHTGEIFITDLRNQRVVIFDKQGRYTYDFRDAEHLAGLRQAMIDSIGQIYVLRNGAVSTISVFDYAGTYLREMVLTNPESNQALEISSFLFDEHDQIYVLAMRPSYIYVFTTSGDPLRSFELFANTGDDTVAINCTDFGTMALVNETLLIPMPITSGVARYKTDGTHLDTFGIEGGGPGELSLPVAAAGDQDGNYWILDKHRHTVLQFDPNGRYLREIGGQGKRPGWFYHPSALVCNQQGQAIVAQTSMGRIQAIDLKDVPTEAEQVAVEATNNAK